MSHGLLQAWAATVRRRGDARAIVQAGDGQSASFRELDTRADAWLRGHAPDATQLRGRGVTFAAPNGIGWIEIFLGLLKAGAVAIPLDPAEPIPAQAALAAALRAGFAWDGQKLHALGDAARYRDPAICLVKLTSGTTGRPRALAFTAGQMLADGRQVTGTMGIRARDQNYALIPFGHSYGLGNLVMPLLAHGVPIICGSAPLPHAIAADFARWRPAVFPGIPVVWRALASADVQLPGLRLAISAGAPLPPEVACEFAARHGRRLHSFYGSSETGGIAYDRSGRGALAGTVGSAMQGVRLRQLAGERLLVSSAAVLTRGNRRRHGRHGAWIMPDRVQLGADGLVTLLGRRGLTVKIGGRRVSLAEVAGQIRRLRGVRDVWCGVSDGPDPLLGAVVATERTPVELRADLLADTAAWKIPKKIRVVRALPVTSRGKSDVSALRALVF